MLIMTLNRGNSLLIAAKKKGEKEKQQVWVCWSKKNSLSALLNVCSLDALGGRVHLGFKCFTILCLGVPVDLNKSVSF